jgi:hypothetical protein
MEFLGLKIDLTNCPSAAHAIVMRPSGEEPALNNQDEELPLGAIFVR